MDFQRLGASGSQRDTLPQNATDVPTLDSMLKMTAGLAEQGYQGGSATQRQQMSNDVAYAQLRFKQKQSDQEAEDDEELQRGTLSQLINEYDDILDTSDPNDPIFQERAPSMMRKRDQLQALLQNKKYDAPRLSGILKRGFESQMLEPTVQGEIGQMVSQKSEDKKATMAQNTKAPQNDEKKQKTEEDNFHTSSTTINLD